MRLSRKHARFCLPDYLGAIHLEMRFQVCYSLVTLIDGHRSAVSPQVEEATPNDALDVWRIGAEVSDPGRRKPKNDRAFTKPGAAVHIQRAPTLGVGLVQIRHQNGVSRRSIQGI